MAEEIPALALKIVQEVYNIKDRFMRTAVLGYKLREMEAEIIVELLAEIYSGAEKKSPGYQEVFLSLTDIDHLRKVVGEEKIRKVYEFSEQKGYHHIKNILHSPQAFRDASREGGVNELPEMEYITLGERKWLARGGKAYYLERLLHDQNPQVIENLLNNPRITEREVIKIASKRPTSAEVLRTVYRNQKWIKRYRVKKALIFNPYTPVEISLRLINFLLVQDLKLLVEEGTVDPRVKKEAERLLKQKGEEKI